MKEPPKVIWLQFYGDESRADCKGEDIDCSTEAVTWCVDKIFDSDYRYVLDKRQVRAKKTAPRRGE